eukprot:COSAG04_NODE_1161_length_8022_cov_6.963019_10_plen_194_part_00
MPQLVASDPAVASFPNPSSGADAAAAPFELDVGVAGGQLFEAKLKRQHVRLEVVEEGLVVFDIEGSEIDTYQFKDLASWIDGLDGQLTMVSRSGKSTTVKAKEASTIAGAMTAAATLLAQRRKEEKRRQKAERRQCSDPNPSSGGEAAPFELEAEPSQVAGGAAAPFELEMAEGKPEPEPEPEPESEFAVDAL